MPTMPFDDSADEPSLPGFGPEQPPVNGNNPFASIMLGHDDPSTQTFHMGDDGAMHEVVVDDELLPAIASAPFDANLAETLDEGDLAAMSNDILALIDDDIESRGPWINRFREGFRMMGLSQSEVDDGPFPGSSTAVMPLISEATVQFWAKALAELVPPEGPCRGTVMGKASQAQVERAKRVADFQNYDIMFLDRGWYSDMSRMLFALPYTGTTFRKTYRDEQMGQNVTEYVKAEDFICNYAMTDLQSSPRYTHRLWRTKNQIKKAQFAGVYRDIDLLEPGLEDLPEETEIKIDAQDFEQTGDGRDSRYELYEVYCEWDIPGAEHTDERGRKTGIELPYIITIDKRSQKVLSIYRDWKEHDSLARRHVIFTKYDFLPSDGFYSWGLLHMVGGMQQAATGALRAIIDGAATASLQGGFVSADAALKDQTLILEPGVWKQVNSSAEDLNKAFWSPPFKEPSPVLFQVLGFLVQRVEKFVSTTDMQTGSVDSKNMPVGSTVAIMEAGQKVFSTIHKGLHKALGDELRQRYELLQVYMPPGGYPYDVEGGHEGVFAEDFQPGVMVIPVSDPNIFSDTQRVAQNQAVYDLACQNPDILKKKEALIRVLKGIKVPDIDELLVDTSPPEPMDPVSEIQALLRGQPVQAYPDQPHEQYLQHYWAFMNNPQFGGHPEVQKQIGPTAMALIGQRLAYAWAAGVRSYGVNAPMLPPPMAPPDAPPQLPGPAPSAMGPQAGLPPQQQLGPEQIAQAAAQIAPQLAQLPGLPQPPDAQAAAQQGADDAHFKGRELDQKDRELSIKEQETQRKLQLEEQSAQLDAQAKAQAIQQAAELHQKKVAEADAKTQTAVQQGFSDQIETQKQAQHNDTKRQLELAKEHAAAQEAAAKAEKSQTESLQQATQSPEAVMGHVLDMVQRVSDAVSKLGGPKKVIRDPETGRAIGVVPVELSTDAPPPTKPKRKVN